MHQLNNPQAAKLLLKSRKETILFCKNISKKQKKSLTSSASIGIYTEIGKNVSVVIASEKKIF